MYYFTSDEHYFHKRIIEYSNRPFKDVEEMNETLIHNNNEVVTKNDVVVHGGDFGWLKTIHDAEKIIKRLNGTHLFVRGSHDRWMNKFYHEIWQKRFGDKFIVVCHYAMLVWPRSHYNSILLFGHSHGHLNSKIQGQCYDIGVDNNNFYPISEEQIFEIMKNKEDNFNYIGEKK